ncbi:hybrid sensor histidine kinase/response regulator [Labrys sp. LIt4]|uniref:Chemotaxis protein CheA n=1 Tax=Labrys okinawensis TaxID=346911 RepID=A0A2S9QJD7_9HYPH|nr:MULTISPECIES: hybrid sensor histidine kinase/response regulator [Labrys]MBP0580312.1 hybrid sensor histidine kinase/response regulator [Labrys sp. LIt4]PRH89464.1 hybrid sensor histidine kinase/response regulator [Labrys okinawensis]
MTQDLSQFSMRDLFRIEAEAQAEALTTALLALDKDPMRADQIEASMRAAHSLKGAARIVEIHAGVTIAHAMEDLFVLAQQHGTQLDHDRIDVLLRGVDLLLSFARSPDLESGSRDGAWQAEADRFVLELNQPPGEGTRPPAPAPVSEPAPVSMPVPMPAMDETSSIPGSTDRALRVSAENLNRLLDLAGESLVESRWLGPFGQSLQRLKRLQLEAATALESLRALLPAQLLDERAQIALDKAQQRLLECRQHLSQRLGELETTDHQATTLAHRLYDQALAIRMRPFSDGIAAYPRMVRNIARELGKKVRLEIIGERTLVDRDILDRLDAPLGHLLRNALDHGIENPGERLSAGKAEEGVVRLEASHRAGTLQITVSDDGRGVDLEQIRQTVIARNLASPDTAGKLSPHELLEFLFLPGFSMKGEVTVISGRGVGLDVVQEMVRQVRGLVRVTSELGEGTRFKLELPLTLSVVRSLIVEIGGEPYAFPFAHIVRAIKIAGDQVKTVEGRQHFSLDGQLVGLVGAHQVLGCAPADNAEDELRVVVVGSPGAMYGLVVERFLGGRELVVQPLDPRLGKIKDISAAALMEDGSPLLIIDVEDIIRSMEKLSSADQLAQVGRKSAGRQEERRKRVLVVDDSLTVRELQRKLLDHHGYEVEVAVDGMDGWNALRNGRFDLLISDIDMPRLDGIELVHRIRQDADLKSLPVMIVSYKDRAEDRQRGLDAGADYYLTKGSFQDDTLINAVVDLIGEAAV